MCEIQEKTTVDARNNDSSFYHNQQRIFKSNALGPHEWHRELPHRVFSDDPIVRKTYYPDVKAVSKRVMFAEVQSCVISQAMRDERQRDLTGAAASSSSSA